MVLETKMKAIIAAIFFIHLVSIHATFRIAPGQYLTNNGPSMSQSDRMGFGRPPRRMTPLADDMEDYSDSADFHLVQNYCKPRYMETEDHGMMMEVASNSTLLHISALEGCEHLASRILWTTGHVDVRDEDGMTPLHWAALSGRVHMMALLLANGANINALDNSNNTVLHYSIFSGNPDATYWLLQLGAPVNAQNFKKETPLHFASRRNEFGIIQMLLNYAALANITDVDGKTAVDLTTEGNDMCTIKFMATRTMKNEERMKKKHIEWNRYGIYG